MLCSRGIFPEIQSKNYSCEIDVQLFSLRARHKKKTTVTYCCRTVRIGVWHVAKADTAIIYSRKRAYFLFEHRNSIIAQAFSIHTFRIKSKDPQWKRAGIHDRGITRREHGVSRIQTQNRLQFSPGKRNALLFT